MKKLAIGEDDFKVFQAFLLGMLISLKDRYEVYSERNRAIAALM